jgi:hypothetical protein
MTYYMGHLPIRVFVVLNISADTCQHDLCTMFQTNYLGFIEESRGMASELGLAVPPRDGVQWSEQPAPSMVLKWEFVSRKQVHGG